MTTIPITLSQASGVPFYRQVVDQMAAMIRAGQIPPGERLPSVRELSAQLLVSLITIRRAYADLETAGLLVRRQGQGTFVADTVDAAARRQAANEAKSVLRSALARARQLGLDGDDLRAFLLAEIDRKGKKR